MYTYFLSIHIKFRKTMKHVCLMFAYALICILSSCASTYYQIYEVKSEGLQTKSDGLVYEDDNCLLFYNLWNESGSLSFVFANKTDKDITIDLTRSFFIKNGVAYDYYQDQTYTEGSSTGLTISKGLTASYSKLMYEYFTWNPVLVKGQAPVQNITNNTIMSSISTKAPKVIIVPAKASKVIPSFNISDFIYKDCGNNKVNYPEKQSETINYTSNNSPLTFSNRITYKIDGQENSIYLQNNFWICSLANYPEEEIFENITLENCDDPLVKTTIEVNKKQAPNRFYNTYEGVYTSDPVQEIPIFGE